MFSAFVEKGECWMGGFQGHTNERATPTQMWPFFLVICPLPSLPRSLRAPPARRQGEEFASVCPSPSCYRYRKVFFPGQLLLVGVPKPTHTHYIP